MLRKRLNFDLTRAVEQYLRNGGTITWCKPAYCAPSQQYRSIPASRHKVAEAIKAKPYDWFTV